MPKHWQIKRLKDNIIFQPNVAVPADNAFVTFMPMECLRDGVIQQREEIYSVIKKNGSYNAFENGDIVIAKVTPCFEHHNMAIAVNLKNGIGYGTSEIFVLRPKNINTPFLNYYLHSDYILGVGVSSMAGVGGLKRVNADVLKHAILILPPLAEQIKIANYLDNKISNIDAYVSERKKERLLLSDLKKAKVAEVVTKGLSPNIPLKDSGIPSIGMIPAHWEVRRFKSFAKTVKGKSTDYFDEPTTNSQIVLTVETLRNDSPQFYNYAVCDDIEQHCTPDDIIIIWDGAGVGEFLRAKEGLISSTTAKIVLNKKMILPEFFWYFGYRIEEVMKHMPTGMGIPHLNPIILANMEFAVPPLDEQRAIASYLDHECDQIEKKCALIDKQIQQLQLLKRALINEVVTGKKAI